MDLMMLITLLVTFFAFLGMAWIFFVFIGIMKDMKGALDARQPVRKVIVERDVDHEPFVIACIEIVRMRRRLEKMDQKDIRQLMRSLERLETYYKEKGYDIVNYEGVYYHEGMNLKASFVPSEEIEKGVRIITKVIKPQINYKNSMIYSAEVEVSFGD
jgi:hypothetical protein